jgi:alcohol dehydrogenase
MFPERWTLLESVIEPEIPSTMKAWRLSRLGGDLTCQDVPAPQVRAGSVLVKVEATAPVSYMKPYVEGRLAP